MNDNKLDIQKVFENHTVVQTEDDNLNAAIITEVEITTVNMYYNDVELKSYNVIIRFLYETDTKNYKTGIISFNDVFCSGRNKFQEFITNFDLIKKNEGKYELDLKALPCKICGVELKHKRPNALYNAVFESVQVKQHYHKLLPMKATIVKLESVPEALRHYTIFHIKGIEKQLRDHEEYTAYISDIDCFKDTNKSDHLTVRITAFVFNGGYAEKKVKYFGCIDEDGPGKKAFDKFCLTFRAVNKKMKVKVDKIKDRFCKVELGPKNDNGRDYITSMTPIEVDDIYTRQQYMNLVKNYS